MKRIGTRTSACHDLETRNETQAHPVVSNAVFSTNGPFHSMLLIISGKEGQFAGSTAKLFQRGL